MKADTFGVPVAAMRISEAASLGAAILAGVAAGRFAGVHEAVDCMVAVERTYDPNEENHRRREDKYREYVEIYPALKDFNSLLSRRGNA